MGGCGGVMRGSSSATALSRFAAASALAASKVALLDAPRPANL